MLLQFYIAQTHGMHAAAILYCTNSMRYCNSVLHKQTVCVLLQFCIAQTRSMRVAVILGVFTLLQHSVYLPCCMNVTT
jgi:hypothetical protein